MHDIFPSRRVQGPVARPRREGAMGSDDGAKSGGGEKRVWTAPMLALSVAGTLSVLLNAMLLLRRDGAGHQGGLAAHQRLSLIDPAGSLVLLDRRVLAPRSAIKTLSWAPRVFEIPGVLTDVECEELIQRAESRLKKMGTFGKATQTVRQSESMFFNLPSDDGDDLIALVRGALLDTLLMPSAYAENLQVTRYKKGDFYGLHYDFSQPNRKKADPKGYPYGDVERYATLVMYLSDGFEGGETVFPRVSTPGSPGKGLLKQVNKVDAETWADIGGLNDFCGQDSDALKAKPAKGGAILFFDYTPDGQRDMETVHGSCPVRSGTKVIAQQWIQINLGYASAMTLENRLARLQRDPSLPPPIPQPPKDTPQWKAPPAAKPTHHSLPTPSGGDDWGGSSDNGRKTKAKRDVRRMQGGVEVLPSGKDAVVTLVTTSEYALGAVALGRTIRVVSPSLHLVALVAPHGVGGKELGAMEIGWMEDAGWKIKRVSCLEREEGSQGLKEIAVRKDLISVAYTKIHAWSLEEYDRVLFLDADTMAVRDIKYFFQEKFWTKAINSVPERGGTVHAGLMALKPNEKDYNRLLAALEDEDNHGWEPADLEQGLISYMFKEDWAEVKETSVFPRERQICPVHCAIPNTEKLRAAQAKRGVLVDFQGIRKPWDWTHSPKPSCSTVTAWAVLWQAILIAPTIQDVADVLEWFDSDRKRILETDGGMAALPFLMRLLERFNDHVPKGGAAKAKVLRTICESRLWEKKLAGEGGGSMMEIFKVLCKDFNKEL